jgi:hypothetical protein
VSEIELANDVAARWLRAWAGDADFADCCTPDVQYEDPLTQEPLSGIDALSAHAHRLRTELPDLKLELTAHPLVDAVYASIPWRAVGTHKQTNRFLSLHGIHYCELADDRIRRARGFFDLYDAAVQLGLLPSRGGIGESVLLLLRGFGLRSS